MKRMNGGYYEVDISDFDLVGIKSGDVEIPSNTNAYKNLFKLYDAVKENQFKHKNIKLKTLYDYDIGVQDCLLSFYYGANNDLVYLSMLFWVIDSNSKTCDRRILQINDDATIEIIDF